MTYAQWLFALTLWREGSSVSHDARYGIACVINNRVAVGGWWGSTIVEVCTHHMQFSSMTQLGNANTVRWPQDNDVVYEDCVSIVGMTGGPDTTSGALYYWTTPLTEAPEVEWGPTVETLCLDGVHFCRPS